MTEPLDLDAIERRAQAATPGPWSRGDLEEPRGKWHDDLIDGDFETGRWPVCAVAHSYEAHKAWDAGNAAFIASSRDDVPALVAEVRRLRVEQEAAVWCREHRAIVTYTPHGIFVAVPWSTLEPAGRMGTGPLPYELLLSVRGTVVDAVARLRNRQGTTVPDKSIREHGLLASLSFGAEYYEIPAWKKDEGTQRPTRDRP